LLACLGLLAGTAAWAGPIDGPVTMRRLVEAGHKTSTGAMAPGVLRLSAEFRGGERACVVAVGDHEPVVDMGLVVYDEAGRKVAEDAGNEAAPDYVAVIWYPPRDGKYVIEIRSAGEIENRVFISLR